MYIYSEEEEEEDKEDKEEDWRQDLLGGLGSSGLVSRKHS